MPIHYRGIIDPDARGFESTCKVVVEKPHEGQKSLPLYGDEFKGFPELRWGHPGGSAAQLAYAILRHRTDDPDLAQKLYRPFRDEFVAEWPPNEPWTLRAQTIDRWIEERPSS